MKLSTVKFDPKAVEDGDWVRDLPGMDDLAFKARGQNSSAWKSLRKKLVNNLPRNLRNRSDGLPQAIEDGLMNKLLVGAGIIGWENLELDPEDWEALGLPPVANPVPYSKEVAEKLIGHPGYFPIREAAIIATDRVGAVIAEADEDLAGNSVNSSGGSSATEGTQVG